MDPIRDVHTASLQGGTPSLACFFSAVNRLPSEPFHNHDRLLQPYALAESLICFSLANPEKMLAIWVRYANQREDLLFLIFGKQGGTINFKKDFGRYVTAVKIVAKPLGPFLCRLEGEEGGLAFMDSSPLIGVKQLTMAISCARPPPNPYHTLWGRP